jgi:hypothetical protein
LPLQDMIVAVELRIGWRSIIPSMSNALPCWM